MRELLIEFIGKGEVKGFHFRQLDKTEKGYLYEVVRQPPEKTAFIFAPPVHMVEPPQKSPLTRAFSFRLKDSQLVCVPFKQRKQGTFPAIDETK